MSYSENPICTVELKCIEANKNIEVKISDIVLSGAGLLGVPKGYPVKVDIQRRGRNFTVTKLLSPTAEDVFGGNEQFIRNVRAFSNKSWVEPSNSNLKKIAVFGVSSSEDKPVLRIEIKGDFLIKAGLKK
jgi:hypothetical protein